MEEITINRALVFYVLFVCIFNQNCADLQYAKYLLQGRLITSIENHMTEIDLDAQPRFADAFDIDNDGDDDLVIIDDHDVLLIYKNVSLGRFSTPPYEFVIEEGAQRIAHGNFDSNGSVDMAVSNQYSDDIAIMLNEGSGDFFEVYYSEVGIEPFAIRAGDLNNDGKIDLLVSHLSENSIINILVGQGDGDFNIKKMIEVGHIPYDIALIDLDNNGFLDILSANFDSNDLSVFHNVGDFLFHTEKVYSITGNPFNLTAVNFNQDDFPDVAVTLFDVDSLAILINNGKGEFDEILKFNTGKSPLSLASADFDGNGWEDIVVANSEEDSLSFYFNDSDYLEQFKIGLEDNFQPTMVKICNFNQNDYPDLVLTYFDNQKVRIYYDIFSPESRDNEIRKF